MATTLTHSPFLSNLYSLNSSEGIRLKSASMREIKTNISSPKIQKFLSPVSIGYKNKNFQKFTILSALASQETNDQTQSESMDEVKSSVDLLKKAAKSKSRSVPKEEVFAALRTLEKAKIDTSSSLSTLGGDESPGRTWMLVFTSGTKEIQKAMKGGKGSGAYFPITAVQRFDAKAMEIENGVFLGPLGSLTFTGPLNWIGKRSPFLFNTLKIQLASLPPFQFNIGKKEDSERIPGVGKEGSKDPFFIWFYIDEEIICARGRGGGVALWCRCKRITKT